MKSHLVLLLITIITLSTTVGATAEQFKLPPQLLKTNQCPQTSMINISKYPWNDYDMSILKQAKRRCGELYLDAPCVKLFRKWGKQDYSVICGN